MGRVPGVRGLLSRAPARTCGSGSPDRRPAWATMSADDDPADEDAPMAVTGRPSPARTAPTLEEVAALAGVGLISLHGADPLPRELEAAGVPTVLAGRPLSAQPATYVDADNVGGARAAVRHLIAGGRSVIGTITGPRDMSVGVDRLQGFR